MSKKEKKRSFESEALILPALKMVLVDTEKEKNNRPTPSTMKKVYKELDEETVLRIIGKLSMKD